MHPQNIQGLQTLGNTNIVLHRGSSVTSTNVIIVRYLIFEGMKSHFETVYFLNNVT